MNKDTAYDAENVAKDKSLDYTKKRVSATIERGRGLGIGHERTPVRLRSQPVETEPGGHQCQKKWTPRPPANMPMMKMDKGHFEPMSYIVRESVFCRCGYLKASPSIAAKNTTAAISPTHQIHVSVI